MKIKTILTATIAIASIYCSAEKYRPGSYVYIDIENTTDAEKKDAPVVVKMDSITQKLKSYRGQRICLFDKGKEINTQFDDLNKDGKIDEAAFLTDMKPHEKLRVMARIVPESYKIKNYEQETYSVLMHRQKNADGTETCTPDTAISSDKDDMYNKVYLHGIVFESAPIAYRAYFNDKQTIDVYGKYKSQLEIPVTKWHTTDKQLAEGYGDDILLVGNSVGVGTFKGFDGKQATHIKQYDKRTQRIVTKGHLRNIIEIEVNGWMYNGEKIDARIRYTQYARHRDVQTDVFFRGNTVGKTFCTGVQKFPEDMQFYTDQKNIVSMWGKGFPQKDTVKYSQKETIGIAVAVDDKYSDGEIEDQLNQLIKLKTDEQNHLQYYFQAYSLKEKEFKTPQEYLNYTKTWKDDVLKPLQITYSTK